eukprot:1351003-Amorphochlora_amoeboformis.AAC.1
MVRVGVRVRVRVNVKVRVRVRVRVGEGLVVGIGNRVSASVMVVYLGVVHWQLQGLMCPIGREYT